MVRAEILADSISIEGRRLTTLELRYPRFVHSELMTHRTFCLAGDSRLDFELPGGGKNGVRRVHHMTIKEFVDKWIDGSAEHEASRHNGRYLSLPNRGDFSASEVAEALGFKSTVNLNAACRTGKVCGAVKKEGQWYAPADAWETWRNLTGGRRRFSLRERLGYMAIRQMDEKTQQIRLSRVKNVQRSGLKEVFEVRTRNYTVSGSKDHLVFTHRGWVRIEDLRVGSDEIYTYKYGTGVSHDPFKKIDGRWVSRWAKEVRDEVSDRQKGLCAETGLPLKRGFHIHHVIPRHQRPDLAFDINNVVAVNAEAHHKIHGTQGWQKGVLLTTGLETVESVSFRGVEETFDLEIEGEFPNFFANGVVVHNSRNASSSRAIPVERLIQDVIDDPAIPTHWGKNQPGMQAREEHEAKVRGLWPFLKSGDCYLPWTALELVQGCPVHVFDWGAQEAWLNARNFAVAQARFFAEAGYHKQIANRLLEPFAHINVVLTATEWDNFFKLRLHADAEPHIQALAQAMKEAMDGSKPKMLSASEWHLPYVTAEDKGSLSDLKYISVARCARVSYKTHDGKPTDPAKDLALGHQLATSGHWSPFEHQAHPQQGRSANFRGWRSFRSELGQ